MVIKNKMEERNVINGLENIILMKKKGISVEEKVTDKVVFGGDEVFSGEKKKIRLETREPKRYVAPREEYLLDHKELFNHDDDGPNKQLILDQSNLDQLKDEMKLQI